MRMLWNENYIINKGKIKKLVWNELEEKGFMNRIRGIMKKCMKSFMIFLIGIFL